MKQRSIAIKLNTKLDRIEQRSRKVPSATFNNLGHALDLELLRTCFNGLDARKAVGVDGITKAQYGSKLESNLQTFLKKIRNGSYYPKPAWIVEIPKVDGSKRPLAISCTEDKIVQEAVRLQLRVNIFGLGSSFFSLVTRLENPISNLFFATPDFHPSLNLQT